MISQETIIALQECERLNREAGLATHALCKTIDELKALVVETVPQLWEVV